MAKTFRDYFDLGVERQFKSSSNLFLGCLVEAIETRINACNLSPEDADQLRRGVAECLCDDMEVAVKNIVSFELHLMQRSHSFKPR